MNHITPLRNNWLRQASTISNLIAELEAELQRMKEKKLSQEFIDKKDAQIQTLVEFFNDTDTLINTYHLCTINQTFEVACLTQMLAKQVTLTELIKYQPKNG